MGLEFIARVRRTTLIAGAVLLMALTTYAPLTQALAVGLGIAWSLLNLLLLERTVVGLTTRGGAPSAMLRRVAPPLIATAGLFGAGGMLLTLLPPMALLAGFLVPFAVLVLKAASLLLLESRAWRWMTANPWRSALIVASILVAAWWLVPTRLMAPAAAEGEAASATGTHATDTHATGAEAPADANATNDGHAAAETHAGGGAHAESGPPKFVNFVSLIAKANHGQPWTEFLHHYEVQVFAILIALFICLVAFLATRNPQMVPGPLQNLVEILVAGLRDFITDILGDKHAARFVPFLGSLFIYIWVMNLSGLVPFVEAPTSNLNTTLALSLTVFVYCQYVGLRGLGVVGYVDHLMGSPRNVTSWLLVPLMLPIHILGELAKPISLSCRLFGNVFGEDMLLVAFVSLGITTLSFAHLPFGLPLQLPFMFLALLTGTLQALVFTVLSAIYLLLMLPHDDHEHEGEAQHAH